MPLHGGYAFTPLSGWNGGRDINPPSCAVCTRPRNRQDPFVIVMERVTIGRQNLLGHRVHRSHTTDPNSGLYGVATR